MTIQLRIDSCYPFPQKTYETFFDEKIPEDHSDYTLLERYKVEGDMNRLYNRIIKDAKKSEPPQITVSAGAPGAGKTMLMRRTLESECPRVAYIDADDVCLREGMPSTYRADLVAGLDRLVNTCFSTTKEKLVAEKKFMRELYTKWSPVSHAATHTILNRLINDRYDIFFGTTASSLDTAKLFKVLKNHGYKIRVLHVTAQDDVRWESIQQRDKTFVQMTRQDIIEKGNLALQRIQDTYLKFSDEVQFFYRSGAQERATLAATWTRGDQKRPVLTVEHDRYYDEIKRIYDEVVCKKLKCPEQRLWEMVVEEPSSRCTPKRRSRG